MTNDGTRVRARTYDGLVLGDKVYMRGLRHGEPGVVIRVSPTVKVLWPSPDHIGTYPPGAVELAGKRGDDAV